MAEGLDSLGYDDRLEFSDAWPSKATWIAIDQVDGLHRWRTYDELTRRPWLLITSASTHVNDPRLDREYALTPRLAATWAVLPRALLSTANGPVLVLDDADSVPLSTLGSANLPIDRFFRLAIAATAALNDVHQAGIVHRDLQPGNLLCDADDSVRITGFAYAAETERVPGAANDIGSSNLAYLAPELATGGQAAATVRSDLYALGVTLFELATGAKPFDAVDAPSWLHTHLAVQPPAVTSRRCDLPNCLDPLIARLLSKQPGLRYASALELEAELRRCHSDWQEAECPRLAFVDVSDNQEDASTQSLIGRTRELGLLQDALDDLLLGRGGIVLVSGEAGLGKTALVTRFFANASGHQLYAMGKGRALGHASPYGLLAAVISSLCKSLRDDPFHSGEYWASRVKLAIGEFGSAVTRLVPELELIIGPPRLDVTPSMTEARRHLHSTLQQLLQAVAAPAHPLVLFLDDLHRADAESLAFLRELEPGLFRHLLLVVAYRNHAEADASAFLAHCRAMNDLVREVPLAPLNEQALSELLLQETSLTDAERSSLKAKIGPDGVNPLYFRQAIAAFREKAMAKDLPSGGTSSLVDLRVEKLPDRTQELLERLALLGNETAVAELALVADLDPVAVLRLLKPAFVAGLIVEHRVGLSFVHDSIWEALATRLTPGARQALHRDFALSLSAAVGRGEQPSLVHRAASHVLEVPADAFPAEETSALVALLIEGARRARGLVAPVVALDYLHYAEQLNPALAVGDEDLACQIRILYGQCLILDASYEVAEDYIDRQLQATSRCDHSAELYRLRCEIFSLQGDYRGALQTLAQGLANLAPDIDLLLPDQAAEALGLGVAETLGADPEDVFGQLGRLTDKRILASIDLLRAVIVPGAFVEPNLMWVASSQIVRLTLAYGLSVSGIEGLAWFGVATAHHLGRYGDAFRYAEVAAELSAQPCFTKARGAALIALERVSVWTRPLPYSVECAESAYRFLVSKGSPSFACYANNHIISDLIVLGAPIERMLLQIDTGLQYARHLEFTDAQTILFIQALYIQRLAGDVGKSIPVPDHAVLAQRVAHSQMGELHFLWELFEGLYLFLEGHLTDAAEHLDRAWALTWAAPVHVHLVDLALFSVLTRAALQTQTGISQDFSRPLQCLRSAAELNPRYFGDRLALAEGEIQRIEGNHLQALLHYEDAIDRATACGAIHIQGLGHELESRCLALVSMYYGARVHLRLGRDAWCRWGAKRLADRLELTHPDLREAPPLAPSLSLPGKHELDVLAITRACQALSREIEPEALIKTLLANATTHAGATFTALLLGAEDDLEVEAIGVAQASGVEVRLKGELPRDLPIPRCLVRHVLERREPLAINGTEALRRFTQDPHLLELERGSVGCIPLLKQNGIIGVLYLENALIPGIFEPARVDVLELIAAQAAISLSNAQLYSDLSAENERRRASESTLRRTQALLALGQAVSRYATFSWKPQTSASLWSRQLLDQLGLPAPSDAGYLDDAALLIHPDDRETFREQLRQGVQSHDAFRLKFRTVALDGNHHFLELAGEPDDTGNGFIGVLLDTTERSVTDIALRAARSELERTSQASVLGELAASIAHEINQPLASILSNAGASVRWLDRATPAVEDALEGIRDILSEGQRAADIVSAMRSLARQAPPQRQPIAVDRVINRVLSVTRADLQDQNVGLITDVAPDAYALGDATQIQQVVRNLIVNAVEAMEGMPPLRRRLYISVRPVRDDIVVIVQDSGPGVAPGCEERVFQAFYTDKPAGMGMGLAICWSIISAHGGSLRCTRGRRGESLFFFTLPRMTEGAA
ncbi:trifunctional serine/threonine-protein kinase/ATP-binding protein/sensor histidine kinase [Pseudomonas oryzihabitans]|uniref:trifunctional serine/threonine-protein kinase/ATP-binding protein/sensor histidine kinase n=1 Tax=Pseudomonas oryzihabitans TaxID=47885 RepID=UPI0011A4ED6C|nr:AAA family ATPase [Pseudomonas oryzihabitans]QEU01927.1 AAA family ATPase [Pseudomonas oryzihabitans]